MTEKGQDQARQVRAYFEKHDMTFDQYYCTTTERASESLITMDRTFTLSN
ncbi:protein of unknown function [Streptococcus thermophilus]|nr:hypothetical protein [Streptococcus thermophilus]CAD0142169.1 protein of unknown function [Streptococcus thermophilus]